MSLPYDEVLTHFKFPDYIEAREYQINAINELAPLPRAGYYAGMGTGKTFMATVSALYKLASGTGDVVVAVMPPILMRQWFRWLESIKPKPKVLAYVGSPKERSALDLEKPDFILMSIQIFKRDYDDIVTKLKNRNIVLIVDEASCIKNVASENHKKVRDLVEREGADFLPLTGTPLTTPIDGYAFIKLVSPGVYRSLAQFENIHVAARDFFNKPTEWQNLDLLAENLKLNSVRLQRREVNDQLPPVTFTPLTYDLEPAHYRLYKQLVEEQLLLLPDNTKIDATQATALRHKMQQIILNFDYFSGVPENVSNGLSLVESILEDGVNKLAVVANYKMTNRKLVQLLQKYNAVAAFGDLTSKQQMDNKDRFIEDPNCRIFILQPSSAGFGLDGLQHVCSDMLFLEMPVVPRDFHQTVARLDRDGQKNPVDVRIAVAMRTIQVKLLADMLQKDELIGKIQPNIFDLRKELFGESD